MAINATAAWTSATALNTALTLAIDNYAAVLVTVSISGTLTAGQVTFEASDDGNNWYVLPGLVQSTFSIFTQWQTSFGAPASFQFSTPGFTQFRVRLSTVLTSTGTLTVNISEVQAPFCVLAVGVQQNGANLQVSSAPVSIASGAFSNQFINASGAAVNIKASAGNLYGLVITNETATAAYLEFFDIATTPVLGTTAVAFAMKIPASSILVMPACEIAMRNFVNGIGFACVTTENGSTTNSVTGVIFYK